MTLSLSHSSRLVARVPVLCQVELPAQELNNSWAIWALAFPPKGKAAPHPSRSSPAGALFFLPPGLSGGGGGGGGVAAKSKSQIEEEGGMEEMEGVGRGVPGIWCTHSKTFFSWNRALYSRWEAGEGEGRIRKRLGKGIETGPRRVRKRQKQEKKGRSRCCEYERGCTQVGKMQALFLKTHSELSCHLAGGKSSFHYCWTLSTQSST